MKNIVFIFALFIFCQVSFSQITREKKTDSLLIVIKNTKEDTTKINSYNSLASLNYYTNSQKTYNYAQKALALALKINYKKGIAYSNNNFGIYYYLKANYPLAIKHIYKSIHLFEEIKHYDGLASNYNGLGIIYIELKNYKQALNYYNLAIKASAKINDKKSTSTYLNNIGDVYLRMKHYQKALWYFEKAIQTNKTKKTKYESGLNYTNIAITLNFLKQYEKAIENSYKSIEIYNDDSSLYNAYNKIELGKSYFHLSQEEKNKKNSNSLLNKSLGFINESLVIFKREESLIDIRDAYSYLSKVYNASNNYQEALTYYEKSTALQDSIFSNDNKSQIEFLTTKRELDLKDKKIEIQNLKINSEARKVYLLFTITTAVLVLFGLFFWLYLSKRKTNAQLSEKNKIITNINKQKDKFFSIIAHDLRGPFNGFLGLTELLAENIDEMENEEIQFAASNMRSSAHNLNGLLENLLEWSRMEQGLIPFSPQEYKLLPVIKECVDTLKDAASNKNISIKTIVEDKTMIFADDPLLKAVIRNILSNAVKFTPKGGSIIIQAKEEDKNTTIAIKDSGIGMDDKIIKNLFQLDVKTNRKGTEDEPSSGLGLILCKEFIEKHGGKIWVESEENIGSTFYFSFPKNINKIL